VCPSWGKHRLVGKCFAVKRFFPQGIFRETGGARCAFNTIIYSECRHSALSLVEGLILQPADAGNDDDMATLLGVLSTLTMEDIQLKIDMLQCLCKVGMLGWLFSGCVLKKTGSAAWCWQKRECVRSKVTARGNRFVLFYFIPNKKLSKRFFVPVPDSLLALTVQRWYARLWSSTGTSQCTMLQSALCWIARTLDVLVFFVLSTYKATASKLQ